MYSHIQDLNTDQLPHGQLVITEEKHLCFSDVTIWKFRKKNKTNHSWIRTLPPHCLQTISVT